MAKSILDEAIEDAKLLKETAVENAKNVLVEAFSDDIKQFVNSQLNETQLQEMGMSPELLVQMLQDKPELMHALMQQMGQPPGAEPASEMGMGMEPEMGMFGSDEEEEEEDGLDLNASGMYEGDGAEQAQDVSFTMPPVTETNEEEDDTMKENEEVVEITQEDLKRAFSEVVRSDLKETHAYQSGPDVAPGFGDAENPNKNAKGGLGEPGAPGERGLEDKEKQEMWKDHEPPAAADWTVKEHAYNKTIEQLRKQVMGLKNENVELREACEFLKRNIQEANLFNQKLIYTQKIVQEAQGLTKPQREAVVEAVDRAESLREVELIYKTFSESLKIAGVLGESKNRAGKVAKNSRHASPGNTLVKESIQREGQGDAYTTRLQEIAGLL